MDIADTLAPASDQLDNTDLIGGPRVFTIERVEVRGGDQPVQIFLREFPRPWRPSKTMRRLLVIAWGTTDPSAWVGRRVRLYRDPDVSFGPSKPGGTRVSAVSHITQTKTIELPVSKNATKRFVIEPLADAPAALVPAGASVEPTVAEVEACVDVDALRAMYRVAGDERREQIMRRVSDLDEEASR